MNSTNISINELRHLGFAGAGTIIAASTGALAILWNLLVSFSSLVGRALDAVAVWPVVCVESPALGAPNDCQRSRINASCL